MDYLFWAQFLLQYDIYFGLYSIFICTNNKNIILHFGEHSIISIHTVVDVYFFPGLFLYIVSSFIFSFMVDWVLGFGSFLGEGFWLMRFGAYGGGFLGTLGLGLSIYTYT